MGKYNKLPLKHIGLTGSWQEHINRGSRGEDFGWWQYQGEPIYSINDGTVMQKDYNSSCGHYLWIKHEFNGYDLWSRYLHLKEASPYVKVGQKVARYQQIGNMGNTGNSTGTHLHFEVWKVPKGWSFNWNDRNKYAVKGTDFVFAFDDQDIAKDTLSVVTKVLGTSKQVKRDTSKNQIEVVGDFLRCRSGAGTNQSVLGYIDYGLYDYTETKDANGYTWYKVPSGWIAGVSGDVKVYKKEEPKPEPTPTPTPVPEPTEDKDKIIAELEKEVEILTNTVKELKTLIDKQKDEIDKLVELNSNYANLNVFEANKEDYYYIKLKEKEKVYF